MNFNSKSLLDVKFNKNVKGYDAYQVDETLDDVIEDYVYYEKRIEADKLTIDQAKAEIARLKNELLQKEIEVKRLQKAVDSIPDDPNVNKSNIDYLRRIAVLEKALYKKGVDPKKL